MAIILEEIALRQAGSKRAINRYTRWRETVYKKKEALV